MASITFTINLCLLYLPTALKQFRELAKLFQREAAAEAEIARWFAQIDAYGDAIRKAFGFAPQIQVIRFSSLTTLFVYTPNSIADWVVRRMGMAPPPTPPAFHRLKKFSQN